MSLIHEALRKARREAAHRDDPGVVFPGGLTGRRRRRGLGTGVLLGVALTVVLASIVGAAVWWTLRPPTTDGIDPNPSPTRPISSTPIHQPAEPTIHPETQTYEVPPDASGSSAADVRPPALDTEAEPVARVTPYTPGTPSEVAEDEVEEAPQPQPARSPPTSGEREFVVEADLGYTVLSLDYIMVSPAESYAQINGLEVRVGGHIEGFTVEEITADWIRLRDSRGPLILRVPSNS